MLSVFTDQVNLPPPTRLPEDENGRDMPYVFLGDEAFPLKPYLLRPYPGRQLDTDAKKVYNYRLSRCRRVIENTFGKYIFPDLLTCLRGKICPEEVC